MLLPAVRVVKSGGFEAWMKAHGKGVQGKLPRMDNAGEQTKAIRKWLEGNGHLA